MQENFSLVNKTHGKLPRLPFVRLKDEILGKGYSLSVAYVDERTSRTLNKKYRQKDRPTNVLSFTLRKNEGELVLCPQVIRREAKDFGRTFPEFLGFLVIHGMLHLKGFEHSSTMEKAETTYDKKYFSGNRRRIVRDESRGRRVPQRGKRS